MAKTRPEINDIGRKMYDESIVRAAWDKGDFAAAASAVIRKFGPEILGYFVGTLRDPNDADEAFSDFCERVWSSISRFQWRCSVRTWLYAIARRSSADVLRRATRGRGRRRSLSDSQLSEIAEHVRTTTLPLLQTEGKNALASLRDELPAEDEELLVLRVDRGLTWRELARIFLDREASSKDELSREEARLRKRFQLLKERLRDRAVARGLLGMEPDD
jgi:RNA polymerase sigma-70 factor (ECF subfamily)